MFDKPIQDYYPAEIAICYGCGRENPQGLHIKTHWDGETGVCRFTPRPEHTAFPGFVYGGLLASLIDCHSIGTAIAAMYTHEGRDPAADTSITCVTGKLDISYKRPTPMGPELLLRATISELGARKAIVACTLEAAGAVCVVGETVAVRVESRAGMQGHHPA